MQFSLARGVGPKSFLEIYRHFGEDIIAMFERKSTMPSKLLTAIEEQEKDIISKLDMLAKLGINYVCIWEENYPELLKQIADPPIVLYYKGVINSQINNSLALVGTRRETNYGRSMAIKFAEEVVSYGYSVVSGMAMGVDKFAHLGAIKASGYPVAVLASSVDKPTPKVNEKLYKSILDTGGLILSEFFPGTNVNAGMFASRNRIIAGLSLGVIVIEAGESSGSLITANLATQYDREVFAIPGRIDSKQSIGTNDLIKRGEAKLVNSIVDVVEEFGYISNTRKTIEKNIPDLTSVEEMIYTCLLTEGKFIEELSEEVSLSLKQVISVVSMLELKGLVSREADGRYYLSI